MTGQIEHQANVFAANLLMPLDGFRRQIAPSSKINLDPISHCSGRYRVRATIGRTKPGDEGS